MPPSWLCACLLWAVSALADEECGCSASRSSKRNTAAISIEGGGDVASAPTLSFNDASRSRIPAGKNTLGTSTPFFPQDGESPAYLVTFAEDFWMDTFEVSNRRFSDFVQATGFVTDAEKYGWSFVHELAVPKKTLDKITKAVKDLEWWLPVYVLRNQWAHL